MSKLRRHVHDKTGSPCSGQRTTNLFAVEGTDAKETDRTPYTLCVRTSREETPVTERRPQRNTVGFVECVSKAQLRQSIRTRLRYLAAVAAFRAAGNGGDHARYEGSWSSICTFNKLTGSASNPGGTSNFRRHPAIRTCTDIPQDHRCFGTRSVHPQHLSGHLCEECNFLRDPIPTLSRSQSAENMAGALS